MGIALGSGIPSLWGRGSERHIPTPAHGDKLKPQDVTPAQLLDGAIKKGATANVCALYLPNSGNTPDKLKDGITPAKPDAMARTVLETQRKVLVF